jgi:hypothetical protein
LSAPVIAVENPRVVAFLFFDRVFTLEGGEEDVCALRNVALVSGGRAGMVRAPQEKVFCRRTLESSSGLTTGRYSLLCKALKAIKYK